MKSFLKILASALLGISGASAQNWRALIVYTDAVDAAYSNANLHQTVFTPLIDEINDIYANSAADTRTEIAGVIWDKSYVGGGNWAQSLVHLGTSTGGMGKYTALLDEYAADILILRDVPSSPPQTSGAALFHSIPWSVPGYSFPTASSIGYGASVVLYDLAWVWAHEVGHSHDATHCDGYRRVINGALADVPYNGSGGVAGFSDIMAYYSGNPECISKYDDGQHTFTTTMTHTFSNPSNTFGLYHPPSGWTLYYPVGITTPTVHNSVAIHNNMDDFIRGYRSTPSNLTITSGMSMEQFDYADFRATGTVTINPGFSAENVSQLSINVGSSALTKRGVEQAHSESKVRPILPAAFSARVRVEPRLIELAGHLPEAANLNVTIVKAAGQVVRTLNLGIMPAGPFTRNLALAMDEGGLYLFRIQAGRRTTTQKVYWDR